MTQIAAVNPTNVVANSDCGPTKMFRYQINLVTTPNFELDFTQQFQGGQIAAIQSIFVDNSLNTSTLTLSLNSNVDIKVPARAQGYIRLLCDSPPKINGSSLGTQIIEIFPLSFPTDTFIWDSQGNLFTFNGSGELLVADTVMRATVISNLQQTQQWLTGDDQVAKPEWGADEMFQLTKTTAGDTNIAAAPGASIGYFIKEIEAHVTGNATLAAAGLTVLTIREGAAGAVIAIAAIFLNATGAAINTAPSFRVLHLVNLNYNFKAANTALVANLSVALSAGEIRINVAGGKTTVIGP
jgi:hypothetical protein